MSLDIYLNGKPAHKKCVCVCGHEHDAQEEDVLYHANITHNLNDMAEAAGIYKELWRPDEIPITKAKEMIEPLRLGYSRLVNNPNKFMAYNPKNGWGSYDTLVEFVAKYLAACEKYPNAHVTVDR